MTTASIPRQRSNDRAHRSSPRVARRELVRQITPISVVASMFVVIIGVEIALAILGSVIGLLIAGLVYIGIIGGLTIFIFKKGAYWHAPFAAQAARRVRRR